MSGDDRCSICNGSWYGCSCEKFSINKNTKQTQRKHYDLIIAWANGEEIEYWSEDSAEWYHVKNPDWYEDSVYRIRPKPTPDIVRRYWAESNGYIDASRDDEDSNLTIVFDGKDGRIKDVIWPFKSFKNT